MSDQSSRKLTGYRLAILSALIILPLLTGAGAYYYFGKTGAKINQDLLTQAESGEVAGSKIKNVKDLTQIAPIMPDAQISSIDTSGNRVNLTLESDKTDSEIKDYYDSYFSSSGWESSDRGVFSKDSKNIQIEIKDGVINMIVSE
ncbi:hypothetical protein A2982_02945 [candidate division WWE3 bacterium RIFCSPLOWO2_01_FULL_39_13]|uniref:Uncharacterized protein n=1 Tax=candidate division WWE3 bacterium RIFCSPLOWO2_01_FULL_39_13 TaxID=1802624 RepID=A0A1F4V309_UNCKA|nr:MAG: hypothetical protein A2982_02945 [candidate division WWE3 bacterium RIFCSPLOWO2_01_FULL_39_13]